MHKYKILLINSFSFIYKYLHTILKKNITIYADFFIHRQAQNFLKEQERAYILKQIFQTLINKK